MNIMQLIQLGALWGVIFGVVFSIAMLILGRINPEMILNDYPPDIRAKHGAMSEATRNLASKVTLLLLVILGLVVALGLGQLREISGVLNFTETLIVSTVIFQMWNCSTSFCSIGSC